MDVLAEIRRVFRLEMETLTKVSEALDDNYVKAAELIFGGSGRVVVSGVGKSGLIAQKIASTMVSTGTPAVFLHSSDGMHGDMGMIQNGDVVLAISKSGETEELVNVCLYARRIGASVVSITAKPSSALGKSSDLVLYTPVPEEACPLNLAPTSSTTAALVVGDALAMVLMKMRGFEPAQFAQLHPGGQLGKRLLVTVADIMRAGEDNPVVNIKAPVREMLYQITSKRCGAVSIIDDDYKLLGLITDFDIRQALEDGSDIFSMQNSDIMNPTATYVYSDEMAVTAAHIMEDRERPYLVLPAIDRESGRVVGMIHLHDMVNKGL
jgi:arabinose-5-phosphate isomerase